MYEKRRTYYEDPSMEISLEEFAGCLFVHIYFYQMNKMVIGRARQIWEEIKTKCYWIGYEEIYTYTKDLRVAKFFDGWEYIGEANWHGDKYEVVKWVLKQD